MKAMHIPFPHCSLPCSSCKCQMFYIYTPSSEVEKTKLTVAIVYRVSKSSNLLTESLNKTVPLKCEQ